MSWVPVEWVKLRRKAKNFFWFWVKMIPFIGIFLAARSDKTSVNGFADAKSGATRLVLDMCDGNPGEPPPDSAFRDPKRLADWGYTGQIVNSEVEGIATFDTLAPGAIPKGSAERAWADNHTALINDQIHKAHAVGVKCYAWMQVLVLPKAVANEFKDQISNAQGRIDVHLPKTQELFRAQLQEIFQKLPDLDGIVIRTGEIYLQSLPYHMAGFSNKGGLTLGSTAILHGPQSHIDMLTILRDEVCVQRNKLVVYRTWDFGNGFHVNPSYYYAVTNAIDPHPNLIFSIKHQAAMRPRDRRFRRQE